MIPLIHVDDREFPVNVEDELEAVGKDQAFERKQSVRRRHGGYGKCDMGNGRWNMGNGIWEMVNGICEMEEIRGRSP
jgi:hypothetical protein